MKITFIKNQLINYASTALVIVYIIGCANPVSPTGGPKDQNAPKITSSKIIQEAGQKKVVIQFDENIQFKNSIELSPFNKKRKPEVVNTRNTLIINIDSNTNSINFNDAIKDLNEGNQAIYPSLIIGKDTQIKYYKYEIHPKIKENPIAYSQINNYIYPHNNSKKGYSMGDGLPATTHLTTYIFVDANKNQIYDSTEWAYTDQLHSYSRPENNKNDSNQITYVDTLAVKIYPPIQNEVKYIIDSNTKRVLLISNYLQGVHNLLESAEEKYIHQDSIIIGLTNFNEIRNKNTHQIKFKYQKISSRGSNKIEYYQFIHNSDTLFFQEKCLPLFGIKNRDTINSIKTNEQPPILNMENPFTNPWGSTYIDISKAQDYIKQIEESLKIQFVSYVRLERELKKAIKANDKQKETKLKPKETKKLGKIQVQNDSNFIVGLSIYKETLPFSQYQIEPGNNEIILPVGNYYYFTWKDENKDGKCSQPEEILEYFFQMDVLEKLENTIIVKKNKNQEKKTLNPAVIQSE